MKKAPGGKRRRAGAERRRLLLELGPGGKDLTLEIRPGDAARVESLARGVSLERDDAGTALRLRLSELDEPWITNGWLSPLVACTMEGCAPVVERDGSRVYSLGIGAPEKERTFYFAVERPRQPVRRRPGRRNPAREARENAEKRIDDLNAFIMESFESSPDLRKKYRALYRAFREIAARRETRRKTGSEDG
jgi:hypothetical protein